MHVAPYVPLPTEIVGLTRQTFSDINREHLALIAAARALPRKVVEGLAFCDGSKRRAALAELSRRMPVEPYVTTKRCVVYRSARACRSPLSDENNRDGIEVCWLAIGLVRGNGCVTDRPASLFVSFHAGARLLQRSWPTADIRSSIYAAHDMLLAAPQATLLPMEATGRWLVPITAGAFACDVHVVRDREQDTHVYLRAETFFETDQLGADQHAQCAAMRFRDSNPTLGDGLCMPPQLRQHIDRATI